MSVHLKNFRVTRQASAHESATAHTGGRCASCIRNFFSDQKLHRKDNRILIFTTDLDIGYDKLCEKYGSSCFIQVSTPIFNADYTKMIISISYMCGPLWGYGSLLVLEKKNGSWRIIDDFETWVS